MRWLFWDPDDPEEAREHARIDAAISQWWKWFAGIAEQVGQRHRTGAPFDYEQIGETLRQVHPKLSWEIGPDHPRDGTKLAITPEGRHDLRPMVRSMIERAPLLPGWRWTEYREAVHPMTAPGAVQARTGHDVSHARFSASVSGERRVDVRVSSPGIESPESPEAFRAAIVAIEALVGEEALDSWLGDVEVEPYSGTKLPLALDELPAAFSSVVSRVVESLPTLPFSEWVSEAKWSQVTREPKEKTDYPGREDLFIATTATPELVRATLLSYPFSSMSFSRLGERFITLKFDGSRGFQAKVADRGAVETAIDDVLRQEGLGAYVSGGTGLRYFYVDLVVTDLRRAIEAVLPRLRTLELPRRSWILPLDADFSGEWIGVWDETPPPPRLT